MKADPFDRQDNTGRLSYRGVEVFVRLKRNGVGFSFTLAPRLHCHGTIPGFREFPAAFAAVRGKIDRHLDAARR